MEPTSSNQQGESASVGTGLSSADRQELVRMLGKALSETYVLYTKSQSVHWNVVGPQFYSIHKLTEEHYEDLAEAVDELAERIRALGAPTPSSFGEFLELSDIGETRERQDCDQAIAMLCADHETAARTFREGTTLADRLEDVVTADLLTERMAKHEKAAWMLRSMLQDPSVQRTGDSNGGQRQQPLRNRRQ
jgi:starvation-inducible DNA-binding protein